jgi:hypothetical protein
MSGMYPPEDSQPLHGALTGDLIEHKLVPGFAMEVRGIQACEQDGARPEPHSQYQVTDPEGSTDWLCAYDCRAVRP